MAHQGLGEFEHLVLLAVVRLKGEVYGVPIVEEIERQTGREVSRAAVYVTLRRLEEKGLVTSWLGDPVAERGGRPRRLVRMAPEGLEALRESRRTLARMWRGVESVVEGAP